jgi:DNA-binding transcriptional MocR family regulator
MPVLVDDPGYYNLFGHLRLAGARLLPVPRGEDGPDLAALARPGGGAPAARAIPRCPC